MDWAPVFSDETVGYLADFTTVLVNGGIIGAAIYAYVRRREFLEWLRNAYAALLALIAELRAANELARAKAAPAPAAPAPSTSEQGQPIPEPVQQQLAPRPTPPPRPTQTAPQVADARPGPKRSKEPSANRPTLAWGIGAAVATFILIVALLRASSTPTPAVTPRTTLQLPVVASAPTHPQPPPLAPPPPREAWSYTVQPNESCWAIAERAEPDPAETGRLWASIVALNPTLCSPRRDHVLRPRSIILIPPTVQPAALTE